MDEQRRKLQESAISDEELESVVGGIQMIEIARCAGCGRSGASAAMYELNGKKYCSACYRRALKD